jgi:excisionase family DNA binding protein
MTTTRECASNGKNENQPSFYTVAEAARILRVDPATIYRAIRAEAFPAVRVRTRYVIPAGAVDQMAEQAIATGTCVDIAAIATARRIGREVARMIGGGQ